MSRPFGVALLMAGFDDRGAQVRQTWYSWLCPVGGCTYVLGRVRLHYASVLDLSTLPLNVPRLVRLLCGQLVWESVATLFFS